MITVRVEGKSVSTFASLEDAWGYLNGYFLSPIDALFFSIEGMAFEMGDGMWKAVCGSPSRLRKYLDWDSDEEISRGF